MFQEAESPHFSSVLNWPDSAIVHYITQDPHFKCKCVSEVGPCQFSVFALAFAVSYLHDLACVVGRGSSFAELCLFFEFCSRSKLFFMKFP